MGQGEIRKFGATAMPVPESFSFPFSYYSRPNDLERKGTAMDGWTGGHRRKRGKFLECLTGET